MSKQENFEDIDKFLDWYKSKRPETVYLVKNKARYAEVMQAVRTIYNFAHDSNPEGTTISMPTPDELTGTSLCVEIVSNLVVFEDMQKFCAALSKADSYETTSRTDGKFLIGIVFEDVYDLAPPSRK